MLLKPFEIAFPAPFVPGTVPRFAPGRLPAPFVIVDPALPRTLDTPPEAPPMMEAADPLTMDGGPDEVVVMPLSPNPALPPSP
jgi:hypothetical protein